MTSGSTGLSEYAMPDFKLIPCWALHFLCDAQQGFYNKEWHDMAQSFKKISIIASVCLAL